VSLWGIRGRRAAALILPACAPLATYGGGGDRDVPRCHPQALFCYQWEGGAAGTAFGFLELPPPSATHRQPRVASADGGDGRGQLARGRGCAAAFSFSLFLGGGGGDATGHGADAVGDLSF